MILPCIDWTAASCIVSSLMAIIAFVALFQNRQQLKQMQKQQDEDLRPRLVFEVISYNTLFLLKIENIGKEMAYDIQLKLSGAFFDNHYSESIKKDLQAIGDNSFHMAPGRKSHYMLTSKSSQGSIRIQEEIFDATKVVEWNKQNYLSKLKIVGTYNGRGTHTVDESVSIRQFFVSEPIVVKDDVVQSLEHITKALTK